MFGFKCKLEDIKADYQRKLAEVQSSHQREVDQLK